MIIDSFEQSHITKLLDWLIDEVLSSGGDGDAAWFSRYYTVLDLLPIITEFNNKLKLPFTISLSEDKKTVNLFKNQECLIITNDENLFKQLPSWMQAKVVW